MIILDTSALIRFFTRDNETKAQKVKKLIETSSVELVLIEPVLMELVFTLLKVYKLQKIKVVEIVKFLLTRHNIKVDQELREGVSLYESNNLSITDCLVIAHAKGYKIASFDEKMIKVKGVKSAW